MKHPFDRPTRQVAVAAAVIAAFLIVVFFLNQVQRYDEAIATAEREARNDSVLIAEHTAQSLETIAAVLTAAASLHDDVEGGRYRDKATIQSLLEAIRGRSRLIHSVSWSDARGNRVATSRHVDPPPLSVADEEDFIALRDGATSELYISAPVHSKLSGDLVIFVSRRLQRSDGAFDGIVTAVVDAGYFATLYREIELGPSRAAVLIRGDGTVLVREPPQEGRLGRSVAAGALFRDHLPVAAAGAYEGRATLAAADRIIGYARVPQSSAVVSVSVSRADVLAGFQRNLLHSGAILGLSLLILGVGARLLAVQLARRQRADNRFRDLLEAAPDAMVIVDQHGAIMVVNDQFEKLFGYARHEILSKPVEILIPERDRAKHAAERAMFVHRPKARPMGPDLGLTGVRKDGSEFPMEVSLSPLQTDDGILVSGAIRDISVRKEIEADLVAARRTAEAASHAKSEFLSSMSHELRTPLNAVIGFAQMLQMDREGTLTAKQKEYCEYVLSGGHHLLELVNDVLDLAGIETGRIKLSIETIGLRAFLDKVRTTMLPLARKAGVSLELDMPDDLGEIQADEFRLRQILINLVSNAIKYNRLNGSVRLSAAEQPSGRVRVTVSDTGVGIRPERAKELFEPFNRLGAEYTSVEGTGIGLALSRKLAHAMNGTIDFQSRLGEGSRFWVELPVAASIPAADAPAHAVAALPSRLAVGGCSLLYIEDNPASLRLMEHLVSTLPDVAMLSAPNGPLGLDMALAHRPNVIVLDLNLPGMSGFEILDRLKSMPETRDIPVVALTAAAFPRDVKKGLSQGFFRYVPKPLVVGVLLDAISDAVALSRTRKAARA